MDAIHRDIPLVVVQRLNVAFQADLLSCPNLPLTTVTNATKPHS